MILYLKDYTGTIAITYSTFTNNKVQYSSCDNVGLSIKDAAKSTTYEDGYPSYGAVKNKVQLVSLITILGHQATFRFNHNELSDNSATKALLYLDFKDRRTYSATTVFRNNTFLRSGAYYEGGAIYVRARSVDQVLDSGTISTDSKYPCGGYTFSNNYFENIIGCPGFSGSVIKFMCIHDSTTANVDNNDRYDKTQVLTIASPDISATNSFNKLLFQNNQYIANAASNLGGVIELYNTLRVEFINETFTKNGDSLCESI